MPRLGSLTQAPRQFTRFGANIVPMCGHGFVRRADDGAYDYPAGMRLASVTIGHGGKFPNILKAPSFTGTFTFTGTTRDKSGAALGSCNVTFFTGDAFSALVGTTTSNVSGAYTFNVPTNGTYQAEGYKIGSPVLTGITRYDSVPGTLDIYLRDPTTADAAATGSGMTRSRVVNV